MPRQACFLLPKARKVNNCVKILLVLQSRHITAPLPRNRHPPILNKTQIGDPREQRRQPSTIFHRPRRACRDHDRGVSL